MSSEIFQKIRRGLRKPPKIIFERIIHELAAELERFAAPRRDKKLDTTQLLRELEFQNISDCWRSLAARPFVGQLGRDFDDFKSKHPTEWARIHQTAQQAMAHQVDLLGSGLIALGEQIDWYKDYKSGFHWQAAYFRSIKYNNLERNSDVKFPWEVSRMQWMIPVGQAFLITRDERYAQTVRRLLEDWIAANPYARSVNWACTMEVAIRTLTWTWFFHVFHDSQAWADETFRGQFLRMLYLHGDFTARHLEKSDINGNHYTADAAGLVFAGLFFAERGRAAGWHRLGWQILNEELPIQVFADGVDYEASLPYHRLVLEFFYLPALYRLKLGLDISPEYRERLVAMAGFTAYYSRPDGSVPLWGDADDARALPFGGQPINDHRYLLGLVGYAFADKELQQYFSGDLAEIYWCLGSDAANSFTPERVQLVQPGSKAFPDGGVYLMRNTVDHVFIDCGPLGLAGRGGHGHNDALSFEAVLCGVHLITDNGAYLYTADYRARNRFRSTASHNTPIVDGEEINRFIRPDYLWNLHDDARPELLEWCSGTESDQFRGQHFGYRRLASAVTTIRSIELFHAEHRLVVKDEFSGDGVHEFLLPLHLAADVDIVQLDSRRFLLSKAEKSFVLAWSGSDGWESAVEASEISPSYGCLVKSRKVVWRCKGQAQKVALEFSIERES